MTKRTLDGVISGKLGELKIVTALGTSAIISDGESCIQLNVGDEFTAVSTHRVYEGLTFTSASLDGLINVQDNTIRVDRLVCIYK